MPQASLTLHSKRNADAVDTILLVVRLFLNKQVRRRTRITAESQNDILCSAPSPVATSLAPATPGRRQRPREKKKRRARVGEKKKGRPVASRDLPTTAIMCARVSGLSGILPYWWFLLFRFLSRACLELLCVASRRSTWHQPTLVPLEFDFRELTREKMCPFHCCWPEPIRLLQLSLTVLLPMMVPFLVVMALTASS